MTTKKFSLISEPQGPQKGLDFHQQLNLSARQVVSGDPEAERPVAGDVQG